MEPLPKISVIIPTYNRKDSLLRTLDSLKQQTFPMDQFVVIVVDDGSTDDTHAITSQPFPFTIRYLRQKNQGATIARNYAATISQSEILVFIDDDITVSPQTLEAFIEKCNQSPKALVMGTINTRSNISTSVYSQVMGNYSLTVHDDSEIHFLDCNSELLGCKRTDFFDIGMFQDPTGGHGWPNWDDVDFGYRAHLKGFRLIGTSKAIAEHWDYSVSNRTMAFQRFFRVGRSAAWFLKRHPELRAVVPMLYDKTPPSWKQDSFLLILRKLTRSLVSSLPIHNSMVKLLSILEKYFPSPILLRRLYYLLHGANLYKGYRAGLQEFNLMGAEE